MDQHTLTDGGWTLGDKRTENLLKKLQSAGTPLEEYVMGGIYYGIKTGLNKAFVIDERTKNKLIEEDPKSAEIIKPFLVGRDIKRYQPPNSGKFIILMPKGWTNLKSGETKNKWKWLRENYPAITCHLAPFSSDGDIRCDMGDYWWELRTCDYYEQFTKPKIIYAEIAINGQFTLDTENYFSDTTSYILGTDSKYLLGILNSRLWSFLFSKVSSEIQGGFYRWKRQYMATLPIYTIDFDNPDDKARHDRMVTLVTEMLELHKHLSSAKTDQEKRLITQEIESTDRQIDSMVYGLYGLTADEIAVVEESVSK